MKDQMIDMSSPQQKQIVLQHLRTLEGFHRVSIVKYRKRRTDRQNRYYHPCFVEPFADFLRSQGEAITNDEAHEILKFKFLRTTRVDRRTGEAMDYTRSSASLNTVEFNEYLDNCAAWLCSFFGIIVPDPSVYHEQQEEAVEA